MTQGGEETGIPDMDGAEEKIAWREMIYEQLEKRGHELPPCQIIPRNILNLGIYGIVDSILKNPHPLKKVKDSLEERHGEERAKALLLEQIIEKANNGEKFRLSFLDTPEMKDELAKIEHKYVMDRARFPANLAKEKITADEFYSATYSIFSSHCFMSNIEKSSPVDINNALQEIEVAYAKHPEFLKDEHKAMNFEHMFGTALSSGAHVLGDRGYYSGVRGAMKGFYTIVANSYLILESLKNRNYAKDVFDKIEILDPSIFGRDYISIKELGEKHLIPRIVDMAVDRRERTEKKFDDYAVRFLLGYGRRIAKLTDNLKTFDELYKKRFLGKQEQHRQIIE